MEKIGYCYECDARDEDCTGEDCDCLPTLCPIAFLPPYEEVWQAAMRRLAQFTSQADNYVNGPPCDSEGDYFLAALDNVVWLHGMMFQGSALDNVGYRKWWHDFIADGDDYPQGGCDGEIRFDYIDAEDERKFPVFD